MSRRKKTTPEETIMNDETKNEDVEEVTPENLDMAQDYAEDVPEVIDPAPTADETRILVLEDGFSAQGVEYKAGDEITFNRATLTKTRDLSGRSWTDWDAETQEKKYGKVMFRKVTDRG